jgi:hypothetical protein
MKTEIKIVQEQDRNRGIITAAVYGVVMMILLLFLSISEPDPPLRDIPVEIQLTPEMILAPTSSSGSDGGAEKSGSIDPKPTPPDQGDLVLTSKNPKPVQHNSGQGGTKPVQNPNPPQQQPDPTFTFGGGGSGGSGGSGTGPGFGQGAGGSGGDGPGGDGTGASRKIVKHACKPERSTDEGTIYLSIQIDDQGRVIRADNIASKSTTSSVSAIEAARRSVLDCMRYDARTGSPVVRTEIKIVVSSN